MVDPGEHISVTLKREFGEEALNLLEASEEDRCRLKKTIEESFAGGFEVNCRAVLQAKHNTGLGDQLN